MKKMHVLILFLCLFTAVGCSKTVKKTHKAEKGPSATVTVDPDTRETSIDTGKGRVVTQGGNKGGGEITFTDDKSGVTHKFQAGGERGSVTVTDGKGAVSSFGTDVDVKASDLGIAFYPGAKVAFGIKTGSPEPGSASRAQLDTSDPYEKPRDFYARATPGAAHHHAANSSKTRMDMWTWHGGDFQYSVVVQQPLPRGDVSITLEKMRIR